jgi:hypothetical protein
LSGQWFDLSRYQHGSSASSVTAHTSSDHSDANPVVATNRIR